jgi:predicted RNase H-like HicB family nuclease
MEHCFGLFEPDRKAGGYTVTFPDFGYGATQGETDAEAMEMAQDLLMLTISDYIREGKQLPVAARPRGAKFRQVPLPALQSAKVQPSRNQTGVLASAEEADQGSAAGLGARPTKSSQRARKSG